MDVHALATAQVRLKQIPCLPYGPFVSMKRRSDFWGGGGKHQRLARAEILGGLLGQAASSNEPIRPEDLRPGPLDGDDEVDTLLELWAMGLLSATLLQNIAASACNVAPRPQMTALKTKPRAMPIGTSNENSTWAIWIPSLQRHYLSSSLCEILGDCPRPRRSCHTQACSLTNSRR